MQCIILFDICCLSPAGASCVVASLVFQPGALATSRQPSTGTASLPPHLKLGSYAATAVREWPYVKVHWTGCRSSQWDCRACTSLALATQACMLNSQQAQHTSHVATQYMCVSWMLLVLPLLLVLCCMMLCLQCPQHAAAATHVPQSWA